MRKQIITALLAISVSVATIAGCGTKKPLQTDNSVSSEQGSSVDEMEPDECPVLIMCAEYENHVSLV